MFRIAALTPLAALGVVATSVGVRLLLLAHRTRGLPEFAMGLGLVLLAFVGAPFSALGRAPALHGSGLDTAAWALGQTGVCAGLSLFFVFTWSVFHRHQRWARIATGVAIAALVGIGAGMIRANLGDASLVEKVTRTRPWALAIEGMMMLAFGWTAVSSLRYWRDMRRRVRLGIGDAVIANRFLLWGVGGAATAAIGSVLVPCQLADLVVIQHPLPLTVMAVMGGVVSVFWTLAFFAPEPYQRWIQARAERATR